MRFVCCAAFGRFWHIATFRCVASIQSLSDQSGHKTRARLMRSETARVHHACPRRGGCVAARGPRAAGRTGAAHRRAHVRSRGRSGSKTAIIAAFVQGPKQLDWVLGRRDKTNVRPVGNSEITANLIRGRRSDFRKMFRRSPLRVGRRRGQRQYGLANLQALRPYHV